MLECLVDRRGWRQSAEASTMRAPAERPHAAHLARDETTRTGGRRLEHHLRQCATSRVTGPREDRARIEGDKDRLFRDGYSETAMRMHTGQSQLPAIRGLLC